MARKPLAGNVAANVTRYGTGAINVDECRIPHTSPADLAESTGKNQHTRYANPGSNRDSYSGDYPPRTDYDGALGRWPANVLLDEEAAALLDAMSGELPSRDGHSTSPSGKYGIYGKFLAAYQKTMHNDTGGASRFFYTAKASRAERNKGLAGMAERDKTDQSSWAGECNVCGCRMMLNGKPTCGHDDFRWTQTRAAANHHPTVKPLDLMQWLCRLICPKGGTVLDPFMGSGTTGIAADREGMDFIGIDQDAEYVEIARKRFIGDAPLFAMVAD